MWDTGIAAGMETLASVIAVNNSLDPSEPHAHHPKPNSTVYRTDHLLGTIRHAKNIPILFIWMKASNITLATSSKNARYAVAFFIPSDTPFQVTDLAFMLLRFQDFHIHDCDYQRFNLISLSYHMGVDGTCGILLYNQNLSHAYCKALHLACQNPTKFKSSRFGHPISTWPPDSDATAVRTNKNISKLMAAVQSETAILFPLKSSHSHRQELSPPLKIQSLSSSLNSVFPLPRLCLSYSVSIITTNNGSVRSPSNYRSLPFLPLRVHIHSHHLSDATSACFGFHRPCGLQFCLLCDRTENDQHLPGSYLAVHNLIH
jgi:hypothetical protein